MEQPMKIELTYNGLLMLDYKSLQNVMCPLWTILILKLSFVVSQGQKYEAPSEKLIHYKRSACLAREQLHNATSPTLSENVFY